MLKRDKILTLIVVLAVFVALAPEVLASTAKNVAFGDDFVTLTGADALYSNPAGVNAGSERFTLELGTKVGLWNNLLYNDYISDEEKDDLLAGIEDGWLVGLDTRTGMKLIVGPVGLFADVKGEAILELAPDIGELILKGNEIDKEYSFDSSQGYGGIYGDVGFNLSLRAPQDLIEEWGVQDLYVGFTYHYLEGMIFNFEGDGNIKFNYGDKANEFVTGDGGFKVRSSTEDDFATGSALDIGARARLNDKYSIGFSAMNIGSLSANKIEYIEYKALFDEEGEFEEFEEVYNEQRDEKIEWVLPSTYRLGVQVDQRSWLTLFADYSYTNYYQQLNDHRFSTAVEIAPLRFLPLRTGFNYSTLEGRTKWAGGFGFYLGPIKADVGVSDLKGLFNNSEGVEGAFNFRIQF
ncbi:hypothetical protein [Halonatronum saccharophilum]|uniref:hypothetical protein n=1 Tax=Halonatronum saccharophilum TaxID=150060 RepID=UPI0004860DB7|nr:hypothetical protein [Halonatronum saccharophilum]